VTDLDEPPDEVDAGKPATEPSSKPSIKPPVRPPPEPKVVRPPPPPPPPPCQPRLDENGILVPCL
jgi:hypothetical protein